jgi:hypothetical protein
MLTVHLFTHSIDINGCLKINQSLLIIFLLTFYKRCLQVVNFRTNYYNTVIRDMVSRVSYLIPISSSLLSIISNVS